MRPGSARPQGAIQAAVGLAVTPTRVNANRHYMV